jgi:two-component system sensor histidine kinase/response regulator
MHKILYIDDEQDNLAVFKLCFKKSFDVTTCYDPTQALALLNETQYDILLVDQQMPEMTGVELLEKAPESDTVRILLTGYSDQVAIIDAINKGRIYYYCTKPWKQEDLMLVLKKAIEFSQLNKRNKLLIENLSKTANQLNTFLNNATHHLKMPVTSQTGLINLLKFEFKNSDTSIFDMLLDTIKSLDRIIKKIEAIAELGYESHDQDNNVDLQEMINDICTENATIIESKGITVDKNIQADHFSSNKSFLKVVLECIIENAFQFSSNKRTPHVSIQSEQNDEMVKISVVDNGMGISADTLSHIFDPFFRGAMESTGSGLGLFVAKKIITSLNGTISATSDGETGATIIIEIPIANTNITNDQEQSQILN